MSLLTVSKIQKESAATNIDVPSTGQFIDLASAAQGDVLYHNGTSYVRLAPGTSGQVLQTAGAGANPVWAADAGGLFSEYAIFIEKHSGDVNGGTNILNTWTTRVLNTSAYNGITSASLGSNQITLPIGNYFIQWSSPFGGAGRVTTRLQDTTTGPTQVGWGTANTASSTRAINSIGYARVTPSVETVYSIDYFTTSVNTTYGLGAGSGNASADSTFTIVTIFKES